MADRPRSCLVEDCGGDGLDPTASPAARAPRTATAIFCPSQKTIVPSRLTGGHRALLCRARTGDLRIEISGAFAMLRGYAFMQGGLLAQIDGMPSRITPVVLATSSFQWGPGFYPTSCPACTDIVLPYCCTPQIVCSSVTSVCSHKSALPC